MADDQNVPIPGQQSNQVGPVPPAGADAPVPPAGVVDQTQVRAAPAPEPAPVPAPEPAPAQVSVPDSTSTPAGAEKKPGNKKLIIGIVVAVVVLAVAGFLAFRSQQAKSGRLHISQAASAMADADKDLVVMDDYTDTDLLLYFVSTSDIDDDKDSLKSASSDLSKAASELDSARSCEWALDATDKTAISSLTDALNARKDLCEKGSDLIDASSSIVEASSSLDDYRSDLSSFQSSISDAIDEVNSAADVASVNNAALASEVQDAKDNVSNLKSDLQAAQSAAPDADLSDYQAVCDKCQSLADSLSAVADAIKAQDATAGSPAIDTFNSTKDQTVSAINALPYDATDTLVTDELKSLAEKCQDARDKASDSTQSLRGYMGADISKLVNGSALLS